MPGASVVVGYDSLSASRLAESHRDLEYKDGYDTRSLLSSPNVAISFSGYNGYPSYCYEDETLLILLEGLIYDATDTEIHSRLLEISQDYRDRRHYKSTITNFIDGSDGDYLVLLYFKKEDRMIIFNDRWGRLPTFFLQHDQVFALSRELKFLLHWIPSIGFDPFAIAEFLTFGYTLGEKTLVKGIRRMARLLSPNRAFGLPGGCRR
jgi:asparagine synthase (glutamine-hydrolysing)